MIALGHGDHHPVYESEIEIGEVAVDLDRASQGRGGCERHRMPAGNESREECPSGVRGPASSQEAIDLDGDEVGNEEISTALGDECRSEAVCRVTPIRCGDERPGIGDDSQRLLAVVRR